MTSSIRLGALGATGVVVAGLAHAGWLAVLWSAGADALPLWVPIGVQVMVTLVLAAAVGWQLWRSASVMQRQIDDLQQPRAPTDVESVPATVLQQRFDFLQHLTERLADRRGPEVSLLLLRVLPSRSGDEPNPAALAEAADLLRTYPACVHGAFVGRLDETGFGLCLPAHGVVAESAGSLMGAAQLATSRPRCVIGAVDGLAGVSLGEALALLSRADQQAVAAGPGQIAVLTARQQGVREPQAMSPA
jgi:hypothetical protein